MKLINTLSSLKNVGVGSGILGTNTKSLSEEEAIKYAMNMGMSDSTRGIQQIFGKMTNKSSLLEELKKKDQKLRQILENPDYGDKAFQAYAGAAIALDPIGWVPLLGWMKKSKSLVDATRYGVGLGGAYGATSYVGEGESRLLNSAAGATMGGVLGLGGAAIGNSIAKSMGRNPMMPSLKDSELKNIQDKALMTRQGKAPTPEEVEEITQNAIKNLRTQKPEKVTDGIKSFYQDVAGDRLWNVAVQNWGAGLVGVATGVAGYNAFNDPESTNAQKVLAGLLFAVGGAGATKAISKIPFGERSLGELISSGIVDDYGLAKRYVQKRKEAFGEVNNLSNLFDDYVRKTMTLSVEERKVLNGMITGEVDKLPDLKGFSDEARQIVKLAGQQLVDAGLLSEKVFRKNADTYLHRTYMKYLKQDISRMGYSAARQLKVIGDELRPRGKTNDKKINISTYNRSLNPDSKIYNRYSDYEAVPIRVAVSKNKYDKFMNALEKKRVERIDNYRFSDTVKDVRDWKVVSEAGDDVVLESTKKIQLRRDFTKKEREAMGEIEDAAFNMAETGRLMTNDLAVFKLYEKIAADDVLAISDDVFKARVASGKIQEQDWVLISKEPLNQSTFVAGNPIPKYGKLAGKYVPKEVADDLQRIQMTKDADGKIMETYLTINRVWKKSKTAWNPVVHVNNTVSNIILYDLADANYKFMGRGFKELQKGLAKEEGDELYKLAKQYGVFDVDLVSRELTKQGREVGEELLKLANDANPEIVNAQNYSLGIFRKLQKKGEKAFGKGYELTAGKLENLYQLEDQAFRMGLFMDRLAKGMNPAEAAADAKKWFIDYDINAPFINTLRRFPTPFISYTYRVVPLLAEAAVKRPWKFAKWSVGAYALNEAGKQFGPGDEEKERNLMREDLRQDLFGMPFLPETLIKTPFASERRDRFGNEIPLYIDVRRFIPGGDVFSVGEKGIGIPIPFTDNKSLKLPTTLTPNFGAVGEIMIPLMTGVDPFTLQKIDGLGLGNDDAVKIQHILSRLSPNIPSTAFSVPFFSQFMGEEGIDIAKKYTPFSNSFGSDKVVTAFRRAVEGGQSTYGTTFTPFEAIMSVFGFKLQPVEMQKLLNIRDADYRRVYNRIRMQFNRIGRELADNRISPEEAEKSVQELYKLLEKETAKYNAEATKLQREPKKLGGVAIDKKYPVDSVAEFPSERENMFTGESYLERETFNKGGFKGFVTDALETVSARNEFPLAQNLIPLEQELYEIQRMSESSQAVTLPQQDEYGGRIQQASGTNPYLTDDPKINAIMEVESSFNPNAYNKDSGAQGLMQIKPSTGQKPGFNVMPLRNNSPEENIRFGRDYYYAMENKYKNLNTALLAYHEGPSYVDKWIARGSKTNELRDEAINYLRNVNAAYERNTNKTKPKSKTSSRLRELGLNVQTPPEDVSLFTI